MIRRTLLIVVALAAVAGLVFGIRQYVDNLPEPGPVWFGSIRKPLQASEGDQLAVARLLDRALRKPERGAPSLPPAFAADRAPRIVALSASDGKHPARVVFGAGQGMGEAVQAALREAASLRKAVPQARWVKIDFVQQAWRMDGTGGMLPASFVRSIHGLAFERESGAAYLPEEVLARRLVDDRKRVQWDALGAYAGSRALPGVPHRPVTEEEPHKLYRFTTSAFFSDGREVTPLFRGHRMFSQVTDEELLATAREAGRYLVRSVDEKGQYVYVYHPDLGAEPDRYNILRHAGTAYAMLELYERTRDPEVLAAARRAVEYLLSHAKPYREAGKAHLCIVEDGNTKLGGNGLAAVALAQYTRVTGDRQFVPALRSLTGWIQAVQRADGNFIHKQNYMTREVSDFVSDYYPGEAILGLMRAYGVDPQPALLDTAEKAARYLIEVRDRDVPDKKLSHDHWLLYALNDLYRQRPNPLYLEHAMRIARVIVASQERAPEVPDMRGTYARRPEATAAATRTEGLAAAYRLARDTGRPEAAAILEAVELSIPFQLQMQYRPESVLYFRDPLRPLGAFREGLSQMEIRNDYVQHNLSSVLALYRIRKEANNPALARAPGAAGPAGARLASPPGTLAPAK